jgi:hypothetical protein
MRRLLVPALATAALAFPVAASADHHLMTVNEVMLSSGGNPAAQFVELLDPIDEPFPNTYVPYKLVAYDGSGARVGGQELGNPFMSRDNTDPFVIASDAAGLGTVRDAALTFGLPPAAGRVCFTRLAAEEPVHCIAYGCPPPQLPGVLSGPAPADGQSLQRTGAGVDLGAPTPNATNAAGGLPACPGGGGGGGTGGGGGGTGGTADTTAPSARLGGKARQDVDKVAISVVLSEAAALTVSGTVNVPGAARTLRFKTVRRQAQAGQRVSVKLKLSRKSRGAVKAALRRGRRIKARVKVSARDSAGNTTTSRRSIRLTN